VEKHSFVYLTECPYAIPEREFSSRVGRLRGGFEELIYLERRVCSDEESEDREVATCEL
jgi:hypothetical protein